MKRVLAIAPHPDDETLGCGGTLLRHRAAGDSIHWVIVTSMPASYGASRRALRETEIKAVADAYGFHSVHRLGFPAAEMEMQPIATLVASLAEVVREIEPQVVLTPYPGDAHTDHRATFAMAAACAKVFRYPSVKTVLAYETLSETDHAIDPLAPPFRPNLFVDVSPYLECKIEILSLFESEMGTHPFPRSPEAVRAQALLRGTQAGCEAAEAFMVLKDIRRLGDAL